MFVSGHRRMDNGAKSRASHHLLLSSRGILAGYHGINRALHSFPKDSGQDPARHILRLRGGRPFKCSHPAITLDRHVHQVEQPPKSLNQKASRPSPLDLIPVWSSARIKLHLSPWEGFCKRKTRRSLSLLAGQERHDHYARPIWSISYRVPYALVFCSI